MFGHYPYLMMMNERMISLLFVTVLYRYLGFCGKTYQRPADRAHTVGLKKRPERDTKVFTLHESALSVHHP